MVERTISWLHQYRRLRVRYERRADIHEAFLQIAGCLICFKLLNRRHFVRRSKAYTWSIRPKESATFIR